MEDFAGRKLRPLENLTTSRVMLHSSRSMPNAQCHQRLAARDPPQSSASAESARLTPPRTGHRRHAASHLRKVVAPRRPGGRPRAPIVRPPREASGDPPALGRCIGARVGPSGLGVRRGLRRRPERTARHSSRGCRCRRRCCLPIIREMIEKQLEGSRIC